MPEYENGKQTRQRILDVTRSLFWVKGYEQTRFEDYSKQYGINTGLVHYYFKKKEALLHEIYADVVAKTDLIASELTNDDQQLLHYIVLYHLMWYYFGNCPEYSRLVEAAVKLRIHSEIVYPAVLNWSYVFDECYALGLSKQSCKVRSLAVVGGQVELMNAFFSGMLQMDALSYAQYDVANALKMLGIPQTAVNKAVEQVEYLMKPYFFTMVEGFVPRYSVS